MSLTDGKENAYGDEELNADNFVGVESSDQACELLTSRLASAKRGVWLDLHGPEQCALLLPAALRAGMSIHSGKDNTVSLRAWGVARTDKDPCPEHAFCIHIVHCLVVRSDGAVLMIKQSYDAAQLFSLPGGFIDAGESVEEAAVRETLEETGVHAHLKGMLHTAHAPAFKRPTRFGHSTILHTPIMCIADESSDVALGETNTAGEIAEVQWVPRSTWAAEQWADSHCHDLLRFALQQLAMLPCKGAQTAATSSPPSVCPAALAAIRKALERQQLGGEGRAPAAASASVGGDLVQGAVPSGYAGLCVEWETQKNDGNMQVYCNDLVGDKRLQAWW